MERLEKEVRIGYNHTRRSYVTVVREHYLREDISCKAEMCILCPDIAGKKIPAQLSLTAMHYAVPDVQCLKHYLEVWQHPSLTNLILLETALTHLRSKAGRQAYSAAKQLLNNSLKHCVLFSNEHHWQTYRLRLPEETMEEWHARLVYIAGVWYANHLQVSGKAPPIVTVTETPESYAQLERGDTEGLLVMAMADYLACFWPELTELAVLRESLAISLSAAKGEAGTKDFTEHLSPQAIQEGLRKGTLLQGRLRVSSFRPRDEATVRVRGEGGEERTVMIVGMKDRNRAIHYDKVTIRILPLQEVHSNATPTGGVASAGKDHVMGVVVGVVQRERSEYVASFEETEDRSRGKTEKVLVVPYDIRIPKIRIGTRQARELRGHRIVVRIDSWEPDSFYPNGHFVHSIGPAGEIETETAVIMIENNLRHPPFSRALLDELPSNSEECPWQVEEEEVRKRRDLRHTHLVFSIDPQGCEDVDDTLSVRHLKHGVTELGVHIADVSHFVQPNSLTDREAQRRSTTVYLADRRYDMLPRTLNADLCSLLSGKDRYAVSVVWKLDSSYNVKDVWYGRTVIRSKYKLTYEVAQKLFDGAAANDVTQEIPELLHSPLSREELEQRVEQLRSAVRSLTSIARVFRERRAQEGAVELESVEVKVQISEDTDTTKIENLVPKQPLEVHETIAECMILANRWVAHRLLSSLPTCSLLRRHPPPSQDRFVNLRACAGARGFRISTGSNKELAASLDAAVSPNDTEMNKVLRILATQAMSQAEYFSTGSLSPDQFSHYGLALDHYTHFTSPIRRYADLIVHRQLLAVVGEGDTEQLPTNTQLAELCTHMNTQHRSAQLAQIASTELFQALYFSGHSSKEERGVVVGVVYSILSKGVMVYVPRYGVKGPVYLQDKNGLVAQPDHVESREEGVIFGAGHLEREESSITVVHPSGQFSLGLLDHVKVQVRTEVSHAHGFSLQLLLLSCVTLGPEQSQPQPTAKREVVAHVVDDLHKTALSTHSPASTGDLYQQTPQDSSLYCLMQHLHSLSISISED